MQSIVVQTIGSQEGCHGLCLYPLTLPMMLGFSHSAFVNAKNLGRHFVEADWVSGPVI